VKNDNLKEAIAELCHDQWSDWMGYLFNRCDCSSNGALVIPKLAVDRWQKQMNTMYEDLSADEKNSDRKEADKFIKLLIKSLEEL